MKRLLFVLFLSLGATACGSQVQSIRKPPSAMVLLLAVVGTSALARRRLMVAEER